jgi:hypothetical protein
LFISKNSDSGCYQLVFVKVLTLKEGMLAAAAADPRTVRRVMAESFMLIRIL